jgi:hypothetical protein
LGLKFISGQIISLVLPRKKLMDLGQAQNPCHSATEHASDFSGKLPLPKM